MDCPPYILAKQFFILHTILYHQKNKNNVLISIEVSWSLMKMWIYWYALQLSTTTSMWGQYNPTKFGNVLWKQTQALCLVADVTVDHGELWIQMSVLWISLTRCLYKELSWNSPVILVSSLQKPRPISHYCKKISARNIHLSVEERPKNGFRVLWRSGFIWPFMAKNTI